LVFVALFVFVCLLYLVFVASTFCSIVH
jgi:hypothetical protein